MKKRGQKVWGKCHDQLSSLGKLQQGVGEVVRQSCLSEEFGVSPRWTRFSVLAALTYLLVAACAECGLRIKIMDFRAQYLVYYIPCS